MTADLYGPGVNWFRSEIGLSAEAAIHSLAGLPGAFRICDGNRLFLGAYPSERSFLVDPDEARPIAHLPESARLWPRWVGLLPYEAFRHWEAQGGSSAFDSDVRAAPHVTRPLWQRYDAVAAVQGDKILIQGSDSVAVRRLERALLSSPLDPKPVLARLRWADPPELAAVHLRRVRSALSLISAGELYQVNLARRFSFLAEGDAFSILDSLGPLAGAPFAAAIDLGDVQVVSTSPELFLELTAGGRVRTRPIKGTRPRHPELLLDERLKRELETSEKEHAELAMVIDIERNDLGRLAETGSVRMVEAPHVVTYPTVHHREALLEAQLRQGVSRRQLIETMSPSGSVTGAPKVAAMQSIARLEAHRRGLYTGSIGYLAADGGLRLSMAIRVLTIKDNLAHYFAGGGIVADSDPAQELEETVWKSEQLRALIRVSGA